MFAWIRILGARQLRRHRARSALMTLSVALGVAAWATTDALDRTLAASLATSASPLDAGVDFHVGRGDAGVPLALAERLAAVPGVAAARPLLLRRVLLTGPLRRPAVLIGVDLSDRDRPGPAGLTVRGGSAADLARAALRGRVPVVVGEALAADLPAGVDAIDALIADEPAGLIRVGAVEARGAGASLGGSVLLTEIRAAGRLAGAAGLASRIDITLTADANPDRARAALEAAVGAAGEVLTPEAHDERVQDALESLRIGFSLCGAGALVLALMLTAGAFAVGVAERRAEVGLLRALGARRGQVLALFLAEAAVLGSLGAALGVPLGWGLASASCGPMLRVLGDVFVPLEARAVAFDGRTLLVAAAAGVATTLIAALVPSWRAAAREPLDSLSPDPIGRDGRGLRLCAAAAAGAVAAAGLGFAFGDAIGPRFRVHATLVALIAAAILAIPAVTSLAARALRPLFERRLGPPGRLAADRLVRHPGGGGLAIAGLAGGAALILQTGGVIRGNEEAVRGWIDTCISGDLFVTAGGPLSASGKTLPMREDLGRLLADEAPGSVVVPMSFRHLPWRHGGRTVRITAMAIDARRYVDANGDRVPPLADLPKYRRLAGPGTALVSENFGALYGVGVGDTIELPGARGPVRLRVVGEVVDYSSSRGLVMVDRARLGAAIGVDGVDVYSLTAPPGADLDRLARSIAQAPWAADRALVVVPIEALRSHILGTVGRLYGVAYVQEVAAAAVAALGVATALLISVLQRRRELGLLRAVGATPGQAAAVLLAEAALMAAVGLGFGLLLGAGLEWYVLRVVLLEEAGFRFPVRFPLGLASATVAAAVAGSLLAGLWPALRAARLPIAEAIAHE